MDVAALILSMLSLVVAVVGTHLANKRSKEAMELSQRAAVDARWSSLQEATQRLIGFDPTAEPVGDRLANLRIAMVALIDELPEWTLLDEWLQTEHALGAALGRQVMESAKPGDSVDQRLSNLDPLMTWAQVLRSNLRRLRSTGHDVDALEKLTSHNKSLIVQTHEKNGWAPRPEANPRISPLE